MTDHDTALEAAARALIRSHGYSEAVVTPVLVQAYMPTVQCIITAYNEAIGEKVGRSADEVIAELGSDYITNLSREREALRAENERLREAITDALHWAQVAIDAPDDIERDKRILDVRMVLRYAALHPQEANDD